MGKKALTCAHCTAKSIYYRHMGRSADMKATRVNAMSPLELYGYITCTHRCVH